ncbi:PEP-CTERM sorting domain-containing protein [Kiritimatiellota bacterium B12222]|nr:PEP-CTERM sorting domain-containing protein [Kiritimatiellota bacterium B12222]
MFHSPQLKLITVGICLFAAVQADNITQKRSNESGKSWATNADWDWTAAGVTAGEYAGNDFITPDTMTVRTPEGTHVTFAGDSLTVYGTLALKSGNNTSATKTVNDLRLAGTISNYVPSYSSTIQTLTGNLSIIGDSLLTGTTSNARNITVASQVSGGTGFTVNHTGNAGAKYTYSNAANTFDGTWQVTSAKLIFDNGGATGTGDVIVDGGLFQINDSWNAGSSLTVNGGTVDFGANDWTVSNLKMGASSLGNGSYDATALNGFGTGTFTGAGNIIVIPEPSSLILLGMASFLIFAFRRK